MSVCTTDTITVTTNSTHETALLARSLAPCMCAGDVMLLDGALGAGKTCFIAALVRALGCTTTATSPTYTIAHFYPLTDAGGNGEQNMGQGAQIIHVDAWRLSGAEEFYDLAMEEFIPDAVTLIEWGQKLAHIFPAHLRMTIDFADKDKEEDCRGKDRRTYSLTGYGRRWIDDWPTITERTATGDFRP